MKKNISIVRGVLIALCCVLLVTGAVGLIVRLTQKNKRPGGDPVKVESIELDKKELLF